MSTEFPKIPLSSLLHLGYTETYDTSQIQRNSIPTDFHQITTIKDILIPMSRFLPGQGTALVGWERKKTKNTAS